MAVTSMAQNSMTNNGRFNSMASAAKFLATGGVETESGGYKYHTFAASGEFTVSRGIHKVEFFLVSGSGGGGNGSAGSGGGGGQVLESATAAALNAGSYPIVIGAGGSTASAGTDSFAFGTTSENGLGGSSSNSGLQVGGASGAGFAGGNGTSHASGGGGGQTQNGGNASGATAGGSGNNRYYRSIGGIGAPAVPSNFTGASINYSGGGGGRARTGGGPVHQGTNQSTQGSSGGGQSAGRGGGGFGATSGWSGVVIVRYAI